MSTSAHRAVSELKRSYARRLRRDMTDAEGHLWFALRAHRLDGLSFRRQTPIGRYIVDFVCHDHHLVIELNGRQHGNSTADIVRDAWLASKGYRVMRFWNSDVLKNREAVLETILTVARQATPLPNPPPQGGREPAPE